MTDEQHDRIKLLCRQIEAEKDHDTFVRLVSELSHLLELCGEQIDCVQATPEVNGHGHSNGYNPYMVLASRPEIPQLLSFMIQATGADFGNIQLFDSSRPGLRIVAQHGFEAEFLTYFDNVCNGSFACGAAMNQHSRVIVADILADSLFRDAQTQGVMLRAKVRACQSTPLFDALGNFIGVASTHFQQPKPFDKTMWEHVDILVDDFTKKISATLTGLA
jgi:hypothetical protein